MTGAHQALAVVVVALAVLTAFRCEVHVDASKACAKPPSAVVTQDAQEPPPAPPGGIAE